MQVVNVTATCRFLHSASLKPSDAESAATAASGSDAAGAFLTKASTPKHHPAVCLSGQAVNHKRNTQFSNTRPAALNPEQSGRGAQNRLLEGRSGQNGQAGSSAARTGLSEQLDFTEFLQRQNSHLKVCIVGRSTICLSHYTSGPYTCLTLG